MNPSTKNIIEVNHIRKEYCAGDECIVALKDIHIQIKKGEICCIFGTSGSGKSTLLNQLAGMEKPTSGEVIINGINISKLNEGDLADFRLDNIGFIFQSYNLMTYMTATENVAMPLMFAGVEKRLRERAAKNLLKKVGLSHRLNHYPGQMSGGQQQRVGIARALVGMPRVIFADEPTGNLDSKSTIEVMELMSGFARQNNQTIILVSHEPELSIYADRIITLKDGSVISDEKGGKFND